jgi:energy-coupling factor transporter ATP-binding protein EcfA2
MAELKLDHIYKIYDNKVTAVQDFNLHIEDKEFIVFVGPSGCGKSTTLRQPLLIKHYTYNDSKAAMHIITEAQLKEWLLLGTNRKIFEWLHSAKILFDRNEYIENLKTELREFPFNGRKIKMGLEFAKLIRRYVDGKALFENKQYLDAYNYVVHSLHHLARLAVIENGRCGAARPLCVGQPAWGEPGESRSLACTGPPALSFRVPTAITDGGTG